jgi:serine/threonine protein kinase
MSLRPGTTVDRYEIEEVLGEGGMAVVLRARHLKLGSRHAIKLLKDCKPSVAQRALQEGQLQSKLRHPNVVQVTDLLTIDDAPALVMEYVEGPTLAQFLRQHRPTMMQCDSLARGIMQGVAAAHAHGMVHRDLKPANILLAPRRGVLVPKIADFGLAKLLQVPTIGGDGEMPHVVTQPGLIMGTPAYMAPEQFENSSQVDARADVFSLGAVLYELLTGNQCFKGDSIMEVWQRIATGDYRRLSELAPDTPRRMQVAVERALVGDSTARERDVNEVMRCWVSDDLGQPVALTEVQVSACWHDVIDTLRWNSQPERDVSPVVHATTQGMTPGQVEVLAASWSPTLDAQSDEHFTPPGLIGKKDHGVVAGALAPSPSLTGQQVARPRADRRPWQVRTLLIAVAALLAVTWWATGRQAPPPRQAPTAVKAPGESVTRDARTSPQKLLLQMHGEVAGASTAHFETARRALLAADFTAAQRALAQLRRDTPRQVAVHCLSSVADYFEDAFVRSAQGSARAAALARNDDDPLARFVRLANRSWREHGNVQGLRSQWAAMQPQLLGDPLGILTRAVALRFVLQGPELLKHIREMQRQHPKHAVYVVFELRTLRRLGHLGEHRRRAMSAVLTFSAVADLQLELALSSLGSGELAAARRHLRPLLADPGVAPRASRHLARIALRLNDEKARLEQVMISLGDQRSPLQRLLFLKWHGNDLASHGRLRTAILVHGHCAKTAALPDYHSANVGAMCLGDSLGFVTQLLPRPRWATATAAFKAALLSPELDSDFRQLHSIHLMTVEAILALHNGQREQAERQAKRLQAMPSERRVFGGVRYFHTLLQRELLLTEAGDRGRARQLAALREAATERTRAGPRVDCDALHFEARLAASLARRESADALYGQVVDGSCLASDERHQLLRAVTAVTLAARYVQSGDAKAARAMLARFGDAWPAPDEDLSATRMAVSLAAEASPNRAGAASK